MSKSKDTKALMRRVKTLERQNETLRNKATDAESTSTSTQPKASVVGHGAVRDPDGNLHTFTGGSLAVL